MMEHLNIPGIVSGELAEEQPNPPRLGPELLSQTTQKYAKESRHSYVRNN